MAKTSSMTRNENQDASSKKRPKTCDNDRPVAPWSDLNDDVLYLVMMQLGVLDFPPFSGVCKSWRSFALSNRSKFMASISPVYISISAEYNEEDYAYYLEDNEGRSSNSVLPHSGGRICVGFTCGHLIFFGSKTRDFWLLDPVTRHGFHFPDIPSQVSDNPAKIRGFLVFSTSMSGWVFVMTDKSHNIWFSVAGQGAWKHVSPIYDKYVDRYMTNMVDLHVFSGKMYAIDDARHLYELRLNPEPKLTLLVTKNFPTFFSGQYLVKLGKSLYIRGYSWANLLYKSYTLDFKEMNWVLRECTRVACPFNQSMLKHSAAVAHGKRKLFVWKYKVRTPQNCLNDNLIDG